jgi:uncharacterized protein YfdQ (DUF2303 family)
MSQLDKPETAKPPRGDAESLLRFGSAVGVPRSPLTADLDVIVDPSEAIPYVVTPNDYTLHSLEDLLPAPTRKRESISVSETQSFIDYLKKHGQPDESVIYADIDAENSRCKLIAVIDDSTPHTANWRDHRCTFAPALSVEWKRWSSRNGVIMNQTDFATWLEDNQADVRSVDGSPSGAQILAMAQAFEVNADKRVKSHINLQSGGVRFEFVEDETKDTRTSMEMFRRFTLALPVFEGSSDAYPIEARLKYRDKDGKVSFWYELIRPDRAFKTAVQSALEQIKASAPLLIIQGTP